jgi:hypothetical protein
MSTHPNPHGHGHGTDSVDEIQFPKVIAVGVVSLVIFALCTWWAAVIMRHETTRVEQKTGATTKPTEIGKEEIGIIDQTPFIVDHRLHYWRTERKAKLESFGWVDRAKGVAHVPIDRAMDAVASGALPIGAPR